MRVDLKFEIGQPVFIKNDLDQNELVVTGFVVRPSNSIIYIVSDCGQETNFYDFELTAEKDTLKQLS
jgi:hypothetical protein